MVHSLPTLSRGEILERGFYVGGDPVRRAILAAGFALALAFAVALAGGALFALAGAS